MFSFYLLPALAAILKIRKRKLAAQTTSSNIITSSNEANYTSDSTNLLINNLSAKINSFEISNSQNANLANTLNILSLQIEVSNRLNMTILSQAQLTSLFYK